MKKLLALCLCAFFLALPVSAEEMTDVSADVSSEETAIPGGTCGEGLTWQLADRILSVSGSGPMDDFADGAPWEPYKDEIENVVLTGGVTTVGASAFEDYDNLRTVDFGSSLTEIGAKAFRSCDGLTEISLPSTFKIFGEDSFRECGSLEKIHCSGGFPSFRLNCLWNSYLQIIYPAERPWPVSLVEELETAFQGRIEFLASDGTDPYEPTEPTVTEPETISETTEKETVPPTTAPEETTEPTTPPTTEAASAPTGEEPTETANEETTEETTVPVEEEEKSGGGWIIGVFGFTAVLSLVLLGVLIFRRSRYEGTFES